MIYLDKYPDSLLNGDGLVSRITGLPNCPWSGAVDATSLEQAYAFRSSNKRLVSLISLDVNPQNFILSFHEQKWKKLWTDFTKDYDPLDVSYIDETETRTNTGTVEDKTDYGRTVTNTGTVTDDTTSTSSAGVYGYNSQNSVPSNTATGNDNSTRTDDLTEQDSGTDTRTRTDDTKETKTINRKGNIGWFTPQNMLRDDIELWMRNYFDIIFEDIDKMICLEVYD